MNSDGFDGRPVSEGSGEPPAGEPTRQSGGNGAETHARRRAARPDNRQTSVIPPVGDETPRHLRDPIEAVTAALNDGPREREQPLSRQRRSPGGGERQAEPGADGRAPDGPTVLRAPVGRVLGLPPRMLPRGTWRWVLRALYLVIAFVVALPVITFAMAYLIVDIPKPGNIRTNQVSTILASDGSELAKIVPPEGNRIDVDLDEVPEPVRDAVIAAEDRNFYTNPGFSYTGFGRALRNNVFGGDTQGGSTITQQYVKNALVGSQRAGVSGLLRKSKELVIATKMSRQWSKEEVLQAYLNIIYFGRGAYGVSAAAEAYFGRPVEELNAAEGALLAALIQRPSTLDPAVDPEGAAQRWNWVLDGMVETGALSPKDRVAQVFPPTVAPDEARAQSQTSGPDGLIQRQVTRELLDLFDIDEQTLNTQGLHITTTIDRPAQEAAEEAVGEHLDGQNPDMRAAVVSIDPRNGAVRAYYGGTDANGYDFANAGVQTGSAFKVFALVAALEQGIGLGYRVDSSPLTVDGINITNVEGGGCGTCNIAEALKRSLNTSYYRLMLELKNGPEDVADAAHKIGIATGFDGVAHTLSEDGEGGPPNNGIVLGQYQTRAIDMASAYATLAASGVYHRPHFVAKVVDADGQVLFDSGTSDDSGEQRIDAGVADNVTAAMQPIAGYSRGHNLAGGRASAAKTGTTQLGDSESNRDAWMVGYTPSLSTAVWVGTLNGDEPLENRWGSPVYGSGLPSDIWKSTMDGALTGTDNEAFPKPTEIGGYAGVPAPAPAPPPPSEMVIQPTIELAPGITIPLGPPTTVPPGAPPPPPPGAPPGAPGGPDSSEQTENPAAPAPPEAPEAPGEPEPPGGPEPAPEEPQQRP